MSRRAGQLISKGINKWLIRVFTGTVAGKARYSSKTVEGTTKQAQQALTKFLREHDTHTRVERTTETVSEFLTRWYETKIDVDTRTKADYQARMDLYVVPELGSTKLCDVTPESVQRVLTKLHDSGLSPRTIRYAHSIMHQAFELALEWSLLGRNPAHKMKLPKRIKRKTTVLDAKQINTLLESSKTHPLHPLWRLLLTSGFRTQEALALKWTDFNVDAPKQHCAAHVQRVLKGDGDGNYFLVENEAKTDASIRAVTLPWSTWESLKTHKQRQAAEILLGGDQYDRQDLVFATRVGTFHDPNRIRRKWKAALTTAKLPEVRLYDTRHSHATALLTKGVNLAWVSDRLGHADVKITKDIYAHVLPEAHREMADVMESILMGTK